MACPISDESLLAIPKKGGPIAGAALFCSFSVSR